MDSGVNFFQLQFDHVHIMNFVHYYTDSIDACVPRVREIERKVRGPKLTRHCKLLATA